MKCFISRVSHHCFYWLIRNCTFTLHHGSQHLMWDKTACLLAGLRLYFFIAASELLWHIMSRPTTWETMTCYLAAANQKGWRGSRTCSSTQHAFVFKAHQPCIGNQLVGLKFAQLQILTFGQRAGASMSFTWTAWSFWMSKAKFLSKNEQHPVRGAEGLPHGHKKQLCS